MPTLEERFWVKVKKTDQCWFWIGGGGRYGAFRIGGRKGRAMLPHRVAYEMLVGPIPDGLILDHLCHHTRCVNPKHLEPTTQAQNNKRARHASRTMTHCKRGHMFDLFNTYIEPSGRRVCRACRLERQRRYAEEATATF